MAVNVVIPLLIPLEENLHNTTRLFSGEREPIQFSEPRYCSLLAEDAAPSASVLKVSATHKSGATVRYSITGGNRDGLFTIDQHSGLITLSATLDYELQRKHELVVSAEAENSSVHAIVAVSVADVNDNPPKFLHNDAQVTVLEGEDVDVPTTIFKVVAEDADSVDAGRLIYSVGGEGVATYPSDTDPFFTINPHSGELIQLKALDRDPPKGKASWKLRVQVRDGQRVPSSLAAATARLPRRTNNLFRSIHQGQSINGLASRKTPTSHSVDTRESPLKSSSQRPSTASSYDPINTNHPSRGNSSSRLFEHKLDKRASPFIGTPPPFPSLLHHFTDRNAVSKGLQSNTSVPEKTENGSNGKGENVKFFVSPLLPYEARGNPSNQRSYLYSKNTQADGGSSQSRRDSVLGSRKSNFHRYPAKLNPRQKPSYRWRRRHYHRHQQGLLSSGKGNNEVTKAHFTSPVTHDDEKTNQTVVAAAYYPEDRKRSSRMISREYSDAELNLYYLNQMTKLPKKVGDRKSNAIEEDIRSRHRIGDGSSPITAIDSEKWGKWQQLSKIKETKSSDSSRFPQSDNIHKIRRRSVPEVPSGTRPPETTLSPDAATARSNEAMSKLKGFFQLPDLPHYEKGLTTDSGGECDDYGSFFFHFNDDDDDASEEEDDEEEDDDPNGLDMLGGDDESGHVHVVETVVTVVVKDLNDNPPLFPNVTIIGEVQENGPIDLSVAVVTAWDADDVDEGTNARLTYSIGKNVLEERSGQAIFAIHPDTGLLTTAVCCLDRETTPEYHIQVVAVDGGGLTGTGQVVVRLADVNDNSPRLSRDVWEVEVEESWAGDPPGNKTLAQFTTVDHDISNYFFYRVVEGSGLGWQYFDVRSRGHVGELYSTAPLDYEDPSHRRGFRFMIQVTDRGRGGWDDPRHTDTAYVSVYLLDINDNPPQFSQPHIHLTLQENVAPGTVLTNLIAQDPDMGGKQEVRYSVVGGWGALTVNADGVVRLWRALDREMAGGDVGVAKVIAVDLGDPPLSSTATLTITVTDVNDCPPRLLPPTLLHVTEGKSAVRLDVLRATDDDVWALGHGPPFLLSLAPTNPPHIFQMFVLKYNSAEDSGRGGAEIWTRGPVDREQYPQLTVDIEVTDAGGLSATQPVTIIVDDINDNPMKSASKIVYLWKTQGGGSDASLGRVYVDDPDDWDLKDKTFSWYGPAHPLFSLHPNTGAIFASSHLREGRYDLQFSVSDRVWDQTDVRANVTVDVRYLQPDALTHAIPLTLTPITPTTLTKGWSPKRGGGGLGMLAKVVKEIVGSSSATVEIVSVYGHPDSDAVYSSALPKATPLVHPPVMSFTCVWLSVRLDDGNYVDPIKLQGLLAIHNRKLEKVMSVGVSLREPANEAGLFGTSFISPSVVSNSQQPSSLASLASTALPLQVVDTNSTSLVTPRLSRSHACPSSHSEESSDSCTRTSCLNGGRCVRNNEGNSRCICPGGSWGRRCKILNRTFEGNGWTWIRPFPPCLPTTLSIRVLTKRPHALILYSGPLSFSSTHPRYPTTPMLTMQLVNGKPQVLMESVRGSVKLEVNAILEVGIWHTLHLHIDAQGVTLMLDLCERGWVEGATDDAHCIAKAAWKDPHSSEDWIGGYPVQLGGLSHPRLSPQQFGWKNSPVDHSLHGCVSHITVNGQLIDLGEPAYSTNSKPGCHSQESACKGSCGLHGHCTGGLSNPWCDCDPGWAPPVCKTPTTPASFGQKSYLKLAISFTPDPYSITSQFRVRTRGQPNGLLMKLENHQRNVALTIRLRGGVVCASVTSGASESPDACVDGYPLGDGSWHTIYASRHGHNLLLAVDDGDIWRHNHTLSALLTSIFDGESRSSILSSSSSSTSSSRGPSSSTSFASSSSSSSSKSSSSSSSFALASSGSQEAPLPLVVDKQNGITVGGVPEYHDASVLNVHNDVSEICIDDLRISGKSLPLPPVVNGTAWGQVTTFQRLEEGCPSHSFCSNTSCLPPLSCHSTWRHSSCSCGPGRQFLGGSCQMVDECIYHPCLHGGTCHDLNPGYQCTCQPYHSGDNCQWAHLPPHTHPLTPMVIAAITLSILALVVIGVVVTFRLHRSRAGRSGELRAAGVEGASEVGGIAAVIETPITAHSNKRKEEPMLLDALKLKIQAEQHSLEGKKSPSLSAKGAGVKEAYHPSSLRRSTVGHDNTKDIASTSLKLPRRVTLCSSDDSCKAKSPAGPPRSMAEGPRVAVVCGKFSTNPPPAQDDLRAYAYEGDGSPSGSLTSATMGLCTDLREEETMKPIIPEYDEVFSLLKKLPDASYGNISSAAHQRTLRLKEESVSPIKTVTERVMGAESAKDKHLSLTSSGADRGPSEAKNSSKQTHVRRKSSLIGFSTSC